MTAKNFLTCTAALALLPFQMEAAADNSAQPSAMTAEAAIARLYENGRRLSDVVGLQIQTPSNQSLGRAGDLIVDTQTGDILFVVVSTGGVLGIGDTLRAVPYSVIREDPERPAILRVVATEAQWTAAPRFEVEQLSAFGRDDRARDIYNYYGAEWKLPEQRENEPTGRRNVTLASWLKGKDVRTGDRTVGTVNDLIVKLDEGRTAVLFHPRAEFAGTSDMFVVPFSGFAVNDLSTNAVATTVTPEQLRSADTLKDSSWASSSSNAVYRWGTRTEANLAASEPQREQPDHPDSTQVPPVESVRRAIQNDSDLREVSTNVDVVTQSNRLVLRGTVPTEDWKDRVEEKAEEAAHGWKVDNHLRVQSTTAD